MTAESAFSKNMLELRFFRFKPNELLSVNPGRKYYRKWRKVSGPARSCTHSNSVVEAGDMALRISKNVYSLRKRGRIRSERHIASLIKHI